MIEADAVTQAPADREDLLEVELLPLIGDVDDAVGVEGLHSCRHGGEVGRGIVEAAVALADDAERQLFVFEHDDRGAFALDGQPFLLEPFDRAGESVTVVAFAVDDVVVHAQPGVDAIELFEAQAHEHLP